MNDEQAALAAEQIRHALDLLKADLEALHARQDHDRNMNAHRLSTLETLAQDHELRIRAASEGVTQFKMWAGFATGGSGIVSLIALIRAFFGG
jgi:hypothetical protein